MAVLSFRRNRVRQTAKPQTGDGRELQTVDGRGQMADGRWQTGEDLDPCALCNLPSHTARGAEMPQVLVAV